MLRRDEAENRNKKAKASVFALLRRNKENLPGISLLE
jgi:hypothetical protein